MIRILIILVLLISSCNAQITAKRAASTINVVNFKTNSELGVVNYKLQRSLFSNWMWVTVTTITPKRLPDSNFYSYSLPTSKFTYYYRIVALMSDKKTYISIPQYIRVTK